MAGNMPSDIPKGRDAKAPEDLRAKIDAIYSGQFLLELGWEFKFEGSNPEISGEIRFIGLQYLRLRKIGTSASDLASTRQEYANLGNEARQFIETLKNARNWDIQADMHLAAIRLGEPVPKTRFPGLSKHQRENGEPYFLELLRLARLLQATADEQVKYATPKRGPKGNPALEVFIRKAADFWILTLERKFKFDHHSPAKPGVAWIFLNRLLVPLIAATGDKVSLAAIKTAIRNENDRRRNLQRP